MHGFRIWLREYLPWLHGLGVSVRAGYRKKFGPGYLKRRVQAASPVRVVIGSSGVCGPGWIPTDMEYLNLLDESHWQNVFAENSVDALLAEHVWEHLAPEEARIAARNCYKYLKPGGYLRVAVPDGFHPKVEYIDAVRVGGSGPGADDHKVLYNHDTFRELLEGVGFQVEMLEYFDSSGQFHATDWDPAAGKIWRSKSFDRRNQDGVLRYTSLIADARKPV
jgi:predicted SAM-dependent methyltransferase